MALQLPIARSLAVSKFDHKPDEFVNSTPAPTMRDETQRDVVCVSVRYLSVVVSFLMFLGFTCIIMPPSTLRGGRILRRNKPVRPSVRPSRYRYRASRRAT